MGLPLVVGVDGSESSLQAVDWAADEAARHGLPLRLVHASLWERYEGTVPSTGAERPADQVAAEHVADAAAERAAARRPEVEVFGEVLPEDAVTALLSAGHAAFALVTGSRGRGGLAGLLLGSVSLAVAARATCPVIVVRGGEETRRGAFGRIVLGAGDGPEDRDAARFAFREAEVRGCGLDVVRAWRAPEHALAAHPLLTDDSVRAHQEHASSVLTGVLAEPARDHPRVAVQRATIEGTARNVLLQESVTADLLVIGAPRRPGHRGLHLGRAGHGVLHHSMCPVAVVPQEG